MDKDNSYFVMRYLDETNPEFLFFIRQNGNRHFFLPKMGVRIYDETKDNVPSYAVKARYADAFNEVVLGRTEEKAAAVKFAFQEALSLKDHLLHSLFHMTSDKFVNETGMEIEIPPKRKRLVLEKRLGYGAITL